MYIKNTLYIIFILTAVNIGGARGRGKFINYLHLNRVGGREGLGIIHFNR